MKIPFMSLILLICGVIFSCTANAYPVARGFQGYATFTSGPDANFFTGDLATCQEKLDAEIRNRAAFGIAVVHSGCVPQFAELPNNLKNAFNILGPECPTCSVLNADTVRYMFPNQYDSVMNLLSKYNIDGYNAEVKKLESNYDLKGFMNELSNLVNPQ